MADKNLVVVADTLSALSQDAASVGAAFYGVPQAEAAALTAQANATAEAEKAKSSQYYAIGAGLIAAALIGAIFVFRK